MKVGDLVVNRFKPEYGYGVIIEGQAYVFVVMFSNHEPSTVQIGRDKLKVIHES